MSAELLMIVPTRGRPRNAEQLRDCWMNTSAGCSDLCFAVDTDDPCRDEYLARLCAVAGSSVFLADGGSMVSALNQAARRFAAAYPVLGFMGDDHRPRTTGWDRQLVDAVAGRTVAIVYGNDLLQGDKMCTAVAMTSSVVRTLGYMAPPQFQHLCIDLVWKDWGEQLNCLDYLPDVILEHMHPANGKAQMDDGYQRVNAPEVITQDSQKYYDYRDGAGMARDLERLRALL
jgi:hypothetical protein